MHIRHVTLLILFFCRASTDTPLPTPSHRFNVWADDRRSLGITPRPSGGEVGGADAAVAFKSDKEREEWEERKRE